MSFGIGIIGAGNIAQIHAGAIQAIPACKLVGFAAKTPDRAAALAQRFGGDSTADIDAFLARSDMQAVTICTPSGTHADLGIRAARAGKHVIVEKPIDVTLEKARALIDACGKAGVKLGAIFQSRFLPSVTLMKQAIDRGRLGPIYVADAYVKWFRPPSYYEAARWRGTRALDGGGALINQSIHTVDLVQHLCGPVASVFGFCDRKRHPNIEGEDTCVAVTKFRNGAVGVIEGTTSIAPGFTRRVEIHGGKGTIVLEGNDISTWSLEGTGEEEVELERLRAAAKDASDGASDPMQLDITAHRDQIAEFVEAVSAGRMPTIDGAQGLKALEIVLAVYRSADTGKLVELPLL